ncbi:MAG: hypothetical protein AB1426_12475 [Bacillota bacterium]
MAGRSQKIVRKSSTWWRHGKHKGLAEIALRLNREVGIRRKRQLEPLDLLQPDWSRRKPR